jgi:hypothetical protein
MKFTMVCRYLLQAQGKGDTLNKGPCSRKMISCFVTHICQRFGPKSSFIFAGMIMLQKSHHHVACLTPWNHGACIHAYSHADLESMKQHTLPSPCCCTTRSLMQRDVLQISL